MMIAMDYGDLAYGISKQKDLGLTVDIQDVQTLPEPGISKAYESRRGQEVGSSFSRDNQPWFNYLLRVFRANATTAHLTISDWTIAGGPGGPIGQDILFNFIEVQPYYTGTSMVTTETLR